MKVTQDAAIVNSLSRQAFGQSAPIVTDVTGLRTLGNTVLSTEENTDKFMSALIDRIATTRFRNLDAVIEFPDLMRDDAEFGAIKQKINFNLPTAEDNAAWNIGNEDFRPTLYDIKKPSVFATYFSGVSTWRIMQTIPHEPLLNSAFDSFSAFRAFTSGIIQAMDDSNRVKINETARAAVASLAAEKAARGSAGVVNLVSLYNSTINPTTPVTSNTAWNDPEWQRWFSGFIRNTISYMASPSALYNDGDGNGNAVIRGTQRDNLHVYLNSALVTAVETNLQADTFHNELVALPGYKEVQYWQGTGDGPIPTLSSTSKIVHKVDSGATVTLDGVVGMLFDRQAVSLGYFNQQTATAVNMIDGYTNYADKVSLQYHIDLSENALILALSDPVIAE